ncbi:MAG TPA: ABC transporter permease [Bryobacteraceae bacterium]|nr:ABC transporter permease [Bryobacteraceae bacterium]
MDRFRQDLSLAFRRLRSSPGFTLAAILTLALGIGANTAIFTAVNALMFQPLPVERPQEVVTLNAHLALNTEFPVTSYPDYLDYRDRNTVLSGLAGFRFDPANFTRGNSNNARIWVYAVTGNYFGVLGVKAMRGRVLGPGDDTTRGGEPVAVITAECWQRRFAGDPNVVGRKIKINGMDYTIVGIAPPGFHGTEIVFTPEVFVPLAMQAQIEPGNSWLDNRDTRNLMVIGRLKPGVTMPQAQAELNALAVELGRQYPNTDAGISIVLSQAGLFGTYIRGTVRAFSAILMGVAGLVLLIACVNLASLLLARAADRRKDTAIRLALGAPRARLVRQLLTESVVLSLAGGVAGFLLAQWLTDLFAAWRPPVEVPIIPTLHMDTHVMFFALVASVLTGIIFGLAPALQSTRAELAPALKNEAVAERLRRFALRDLLVTAQVAMSVVLIVGSVLVVRSLQHALTLPLGFEPRHAASVSFDMTLQGYDRTRVDELNRRLLDHVRSVPGIEAAGLTVGIPLSLHWNNNGVLIEGKPMPKPADTPLAAVYEISPGYFRAAGTRLIRGRDFDDNDKRGAPMVAVVNETFARQLLPGEDPIGKRFRSSQHSPWEQIVGVVEDGKYRSLGERTMIAEFLPIAQHTPEDETIVARSTLPEEQVAGMLRRAVNELDPAMPVYDVGSVADHLGLVLFPARIAAIVLGAFGVLAIVLAATGVYGIMAYAVARRTREIGIRMALGANAPQVLRVVLSHTALLVGAGTVVGVALALAAGRLFAQILYGVSATDPFTYALAIVAMAAVAFWACWFPARRAMRIDPVTALRTE